MCPLHFGCFGRYDLTRSEQRRSSRVVGVPALKIGIQLASLRQPFKQALLTANRLGAQAVEIDARRELKPVELTQSALRQIRKTFEDLNLRVSAVRYQTRRGYDVADALEDRVAGTKSAMKMAQMLGSAVVVNQVGRVPQKTDSPEWNLLVQALTDIGNYGQHYGALLAAETGTESGADLARLLAAIPQGTIGVDLNPGNLIVNDHSPLEVVETVGDAILHVHASDGVRDLARGRGIEVPLGRGSADYPALLGALEERNYRGYFTIQRTGAEDPVFESGQAVNYLRSL